MLRQGLGGPLARRTGRTSQERRHRRGRSPSAQSVARLRLLRRRDPLGTVRTETRARPGSSVIAQAGARRHELWTGLRVSTRRRRSSAVRRGPAGRRRGLRRERRPVTGQLTRRIAVRVRPAPVRAAPVRPVPVTAALVRAAPVRAALVRAAWERAAPVRPALVRAALVRAARERSARVRAARVRPALVTPGVVRTGQGRTSAPPRTGRHRPHGRAEARLRGSDRGRLTVPPVRPRPLTGTVPGQRDPLAAHGPSRPADPLGRPRRAATR